MINDEFYILEVEKSLVIALRTIIELEYRIADYESKIEWLEGELRAYQTPAFQKILKYGDNVIEFKKRDNKVK